MSNLNILIIPLDSGKYLFPYASFSAQGIENRNVLFCHLQHCIKCTPSVPCVGYVILVCQYITKPLHILYLNSFHLLWIACKYYAILFPTLTCIILELSLHCALSLHCFRVLCTVPQISDFVIVSIGGHGRCLLKDCEHIWTDPGLGQHPTG